MFLVWTTGSTLVPLPQTPVSQIEITQDGVFNITDGAGRCGDPGGNATLLQMVNNGTTDADLPAGRTTTYVGKFTNNGTFQVKTGTLVLAGLAEQGMGQTELYTNGTLKLTSATEGRVYNVRIGALIGDGTVDGNLILNSIPGYPAPVLSPGFNAPGPNGAHGTGLIAITESFDIYNAADVRIDLLGQGSNDLITVGGYAALNGTLTVWAPTTYTPAAGTVHTFLTAGGGFLRDFTAKVMPPNNSWVINGRNHYWRSGNSPAMYWVIVERYGPP